MVSLNLCCKSLRLCKTIAFNSKTTYRFLQKDSFLLLNPTRRIALSSFCNLSLKTAVSSEKSLNKDSYTASYLIHSCGLTPETAFLASGKVHFKNPEKPDAVLTFFRNHGFSETQLAKLVRIRPSVLLSSPENTLLPKFEFFYSIGFTNNDLARTLSQNPALLMRSLMHHMLPNYDFLKSVLKSNRKIVAAMKRSSWILLEQHSKNIAPNITFLQGLGVPESCVICLLAHYPEAVLQNHDKFIETVNEVKEMGFDPLRSTFVLAVHALSGKGNKSIWNRCYELYKKWGWSEDEILFAFRKHPQCMLLSEKKISGVMDFLLNKMEWPSSAILRNPAILCFSLEKRIIPRCSVIQALSLKGLITKDVKLSTVLQKVEYYFLKKFVIKYEAELPQIWGVYKGEVDA